MKLHAANFAAPVAGSQGGVVLYGSRADKQVRYVDSTIPLIYAEAARAVLPNLPRDARAIHDWARAGKYLPENISGDEVRTAAEVLEGGGDCDDWASLLVAAYGRAGFPVQLVTAGDESDNFEHVYVQVFDGGRWIVSDPKGSQRGHAFGEETRFPVRRVWTERGEITQGSGCTQCDNAPAAGSGYNQLDEIAKQFTRTQYIGGGLTYGFRPDGSKAQISGTVKTLVLARVADDVPVNVSRDVWKLSNSPVPLNVPAIAAEWAAQGRPLTPQETEYLNLVAPEVAARLTRGAVPDDKFVAAWISAQLTTQDALRISDAIGVEGSEDARRAGIADYLIVLANAQGVTLRSGLEKLGFAPPQQDSDLGSAGIFSDITDKLQAAGKKASEIARAVQTGVGVALQQVGRAVIKLEQRAPWFGTFISRPLGFHLQATALEQLGNAVRDGSISAFDEKILSRATADTLTAAGQAFLIAGAVPSPYSALFIAIGTVSVAAGKALDGAIDAAETARKMKENPNYGATVLHYDEAGRQVDAQGVPVDPYAQQIAQLQALQGAAAPVQDWIYADWGVYGVLPTRFNANGNPAQVWNGQQWLLVA